MVRLHNDRPSEEEELVREGGIYVSRGGGHEVGCDDETCAPDENVEDALEDDEVPGTPDDLPYNYGVEVPAPTDQLLQSPDHRNSGFGGLGITEADKDVDEAAPLGARDERDLWDKQRPLISESADEEPRYAGLEDDDLAAVEAAEGDDAAETVSEAPEGESATGSTNVSPHGGFPADHED
jgi:hypothetical protein